VTVSQGGGRKIGVRGFTPPTRFFGRGSREDHNLAFQEMADHLIEVFDLKISRQAVAAHLREQEWNLRATSRAQPLLREDLDHFASSRPQTILFQKSELLFEKKR